MQDIALILSEYEDIHSLLHKPIIATQRIKYTCFNASANHIVVGSTSGSLYLFTREPCIFQQLIPLSEGPVTHVLISPDERTIALATKRGSVCVINLKPSVKLLSISNEHVGEAITSLCWNAKSTEIYVGDNNGKISTIVLSIFTVNGMFQAPSCALMHLDSSIVQMDFSMHYLLVSTLTRCYICDTAQEQFKQIGNKARDGEFGACFLKNVTECEKKSPSTLDDDKVSNITGGLNAIIGLNDDSAEEQSLTIYCSRPGCRLWEVTANGIVVKTHQFKEALSIPPSNIYQSSTLKSLQGSKISQNCGPQSLNFSRLFVVSRKYLLSYTTSGLYIIDPVNAAVILWTDQFTNISMAHIINEKIYLMTASGTFHCLMLSSVDSLILKLYDWKLYNDCFQVCTIFRSELMKLIIESNEIKFDLDSVQGNNDIVSVLQPIISALQPNFNTQPQRMHSGIVMVHSGNGKLRNEENRLFTPATKNNCSRNEQIVDREFESSSDSEIVCKNVMKKTVATSQEERTAETTTEEIIHSLSQINLNNSETIQSLPEDVNNDEAAFSESRTKEIEIATSDIQSDLEPVNILIRTLKTSMTADEIEEIICKIVKTISEINSKYESISELKKFLYEVVRSIERHYFQSLLENVPLELLSTTENVCVLNEVVKAFVDLNVSNYSECTCGFPKITGPLNEPKFHEVGRSLLEGFLKEDNERCISLCKNVPYMWRDYLPIYINGKGVLDDIIRLCLQIRDNTVLSILLPLLDTKQWQIVVECVKRMEKGLCLACRKKDTENVLTSTDNEIGIDWGGVGLEVMKKEGPNGALKFLFNVESVLPKIKLKENIYQSLIFTKLLHHHGLDHTVEFDRNKSGNNEYSSLCSAEARKNLVEALEKDLQRPVSENIFGNGPHHWGIRFKPKASTCPSCTLPLQTPVLLGNNGISIFPCGHAYHVNCLIEKKLTSCFLHS